MKCLPADTAQNQKRRHWRDGLSIIGQRKECNGMDLELFGTLGPACHDVKPLKRMIESGMNGIRLNLSHASLEEKQDWIAALHEAQKETGQRVTLLVDLRGRELPSSS